MNVTWVCSHRKTSDVVACCTSSLLLAKTPTSASKSTVPSQSDKASEFIWKSLMTFSSRHFVM